VGREPVEAGEVRVDDAGNVTIGVPAAVVYVQAPEPGGGDAPEEDGD